MPTTPMMPLLTRREFAKLMRVEGSTVYRWARTGVIEYGHLAQGAGDSARAMLDAAYSRRSGHERGMAGTGEDG